MTQVITENVLPGLNIFKGFFYRAVNESSNYYNSVNFNLPLDIYILFFKTQDSLNKFRHNDSFKIKYKSL
jgi:hypothetical protein